MCVFIKIEFFKLFFYNILLSFSFLLIIRKTKIESWIENEFMCLFILVIEIMLSFCDEFDDLG